MNGGDGICFYASSTGVVAVATLRDVTSDGTTSRDWSGRAIFVDGAFSKQ